MQQVFCRAAPKAKIIIRNNILVKFTELSCHMPKLFFKIGNMTHEQHPPFTKLYCQALQKQAYGSSARSHQLCHDLGDFYEAVDNIMDKLRAARTNAIDGGLRFKDLDKCDYGFQLVRQTMRDKLTKNYELLTKLRARDPQYKILTERVFSENLRETPNTIKVVEATIGLLQELGATAKEYDTHGLPVRELARTEWLKAVESAIGGLRFEIDGLKSSLAIALDASIGAHLNGR